MCERGIARKDEQRIEMALTLASAPVLATRRLLHHNHVFTIRDDSCRLKETRHSGLLQKPAASEAKSTQKS